MNRRHFLKNLTVSTCGGLAALSGNPFSAKIKLAQAATGKTLVVLFQRGGCDGVNTLIPYGDPDYYGLRPNIAIAPPSASDTASAIDLNGFFGLHPALSRLKPHYESQKLAIFPAVHYPNASRSHFDSQQFIESAYNSRNIDGWLNRYLQVTPGSGEIRAASFGTETAQALRGAFTVSAINDLTTFNLGIPDAESATLLSNLSRTYDELSTDGRAYRSLLQQFGRRMIDDLASLRNIDASTYVPANGAQYGTDSTSRQMKQLAQIIKAGVGLEAATLSIGGWDTHSDQGGGLPGGRQYGSLARFGDLIDAFVTDLGTHMDNLILLTCTEFGRTAAENGSRGTDHGHASCWFAIGGGVKGGIYGDWPGLANSQLHEGRYLAMATDYRDILGDILTRHMVSNDLSLVLPDHQYRSLGLIS